MICLARKTPKDGKEENIRVRVTPEQKLLLKLQEAEEAVKDGEGWLDLDELKALVGE